MNKANYCSILLLSIYMKKLIINPKNFSLNYNDENIFLQKCFLNYLEKKNFKKIKYSINSKTNFEIENEISRIKENKEIYKEILQELYPMLNKLNKVNWNYKSWNLLLGFWLNGYISIVRNRIDLIKPIVNSEINYEEQIRIGKNVSLISNDLRNFSYKCGLIKWNEKLLSRILYIAHTKNFDNKASLLNSKNNTPKKNDKLNEKIFYNLKINVIKIFERIFCFKNKYLFYNSYINDKFKLCKIIFKLGDIPFAYSFSFFDNKIVKKEINISLRKEIKLNFDSKNLDIKILKFLLTEMLPTIYLEGFQEQKKLADNSYLPKKIKKIFISHAYTDNSFKFWLAEQINRGAKIIHGQHGAGHNIYKEFFGDYHETNISEKYFTWGWKNKNKKIVPVGNYLIKEKDSNKILYNKKFLLVFPVANIFKRDANIFYADSLAEDVIEYQKFIDNIDSNLLNFFSTRNHPQKARRELDFLNFISYDKKKIKNIQTNISFDKAITNCGLIIFNYLSTEFFKLISLNIPCLLLLNKNVFNYLVADEVKIDFYKLSDVGIFYTDGAELAKQVNKISNNIENWWSDEKSIKIKKEFCDRYSSSNFNTQLFVNELKSHDK